MIASKAHYVPLLLVFYTTLNCYNQTNSNKVRDIFAYAPENMPIVGQGYIVPPYTHDNKPLNIEVFRLHNSIKIVSDNIQEKKSPSTRLKAEGLGGEQFEK